MKRIIRGIVSAVILFMLSGIGAYGEAAADGYDETRACIGPRADMIDVYLSPIFPSPFQSYKPIQQQPIDIPKAGPKGDQNHA